MSTTVRDELLWRFAKTDDPEIEARDQQIVDVLLEVNPRMRQKLLDKVRLEVRLTEVRDALRHVLACRRFAVSQNDEERIEACTDLATLKRWHDQAVTAPTVADALR